MQTQSLLVAPPHTSNLAALIRSGKVHYRLQPDGTTHCLPRHHGFCDRCGAAFGTDKSFDAHMLTPDGPGCRPPIAAGLVSSPNKYGTPVWRLPRRKAKS